MRNRYDLKQAITRYLRCLCCTSQVSCSDLLLSGPLYVPITINVKTLLSLAL